MESVIKALGAEVPEIDAKSAGTVIFAFILMFSIGEYLNLSPLPQTAKNTYRVLRVLNYFAVITFVVTSAILASMVSVSPTLLTVTNTPVKYVWMACLVYFFSLFGVTFMGTVENSRLAHKPSPTLSVTCHLSPVTVADSDPASWDRHTCHLRHSEELFAQGHVLEAANQGLAKAQGVLADRHHWGSHGIEQDPEKCFEWAMQAAEGGDKLGQGRVGFAYHSGEGVERSWEEAVRWYERAAEQGDMGAAYNIGLIYEQGDQSVPQDYAKAMVWFRKSADAGWPRAMKSLGVLYRNGQGAPRNLETARSWFRKAAQQHLPAGQCLLGTMLVKGEGGPRELSEGFTLWQRAAAKGEEEAQRLVRSMEKFIGTIP